jgi:hypothetical protein
MLPINFEKESFVKRALSFANVDSESAVWQLYNAYTNPSALHRFIVTHRHTKGRWSRDDHGFVLIETAAIACTAVIWYFLPLTTYSIKTLVRALLSFVCFDFYIIGTIFTTIIWFVLNRFWKAPNSFHTTEQDVEYRFCFDVFCNSFVSVLVDVNLGFILMQTLRKLIGGWVVCVFLTNTFFTASMIHFVVLAVPNILILPFIKKFGIMSFIIPILVIYVISIIFSIDIGSIWMTFHFGSN